MFSCSFWCGTNSALNIVNVSSYFPAIDHRTWNTGLPVRSAILKPCAGRLVVGWVTTSEYLLLIVFGFLDLTKTSNVSWHPLRCAMSTILYPSQASKIHFYDSQSLTPNSGSSKQHPTFSKSHPQIAYRNGRRPSAFNHSTTSSPPAKTTGDSVRRSGRAGVAEEAPGADKSSYLVYAVRILRHGAKEDILCFIIKSVAVVELLCGRVTRIRGPLILVVLPLF
jgi:hypothetical protein